MKEEVGKERMEVMTVNGKEKAEAVVVNVKVEKGLAMEEEERSHSMRSRRECVKS